MSEDVYMSEDLYAALELERDASPSEIKQRYRELARRYHPDRNPGNEDAEYRFKAAAEAYRVLSDPEAKRRYDLGPSWGQKRRDRTQQPSDVFEELFFGGRRKKRASGRKRRASSTSGFRGRDLRYHLELSFEEAALGVKRRISVPKPHPCEGCGSTGTKPGTSPALCATCGGSGTAKKRQGFFDVASKCQDCRGTGKRSAYDCPRCEGTGQVETHRAIEIQIPHGVESGTRLKVSGEGESAPPGGIPGDLFVVVHFKPHPFFEREEQDVFVEVPLPFHEAILGTQLEVPTLEGKVTVRVPPGSQSGRVFRLKGKGFPSMDGRSRGDQRVRIVAEIPDALTEAQRAALRAYAAAEEGLGGCERSRAFRVRMQKQYGP